MANETPVIQNSKMLLLALGLAAIVVILYNVHINQIRQAGKSDMVPLLKYKLPKKVGETISDKDDLTSVLVPRDVANGFNSVRKEENRQDVVGKTLVRSVAAGDWVLLDDYNGPSTEGPSSKIPIGDVVVTLPVDPKFSQGKVLRLGDKIDVLGYVQNASGQYEVMHLIDGLIVFGIGGRTLSDSPKRDDEGSASYREIQVTLPKGLEKQMYNVLSHVRGQQVIISIRNPFDPSEKPKGFSSDLSEDKINKAAPARSGSGLNFGPAGGGNSGDAPPLN